MKAEDNNRMEALAYIIADLKAENMMMTERVHQLTDDYNDVARQLRGKEKHEPNTEGYTLGELTEAMDKCEALKKDNKMLKQQCVQTTGRTSRRRCVTLMQPSPTSNCKAIPRT